MTLKTLKDLQGYCNQATIIRSKKRTNQVRAVRCDILKEEAINQYKAIDEKKCKWNREDVLNWIEYFFNLTKKDVNVLEDEHGN